MRRFFVVLTIIFCMLLSGCGKEDSQLQKALDFRTSLLEAGGCSFTAQVQADYGETLYDFTLQCRYEDGTGYFKVLAPESVAGITATVKNGSTGLEFDGLSLEYGSLANGNVAPLAVPWILASAWEQDYISSAGKEDDHLRVTILKGYNEEELTIDTWLQQRIPEFAEITYDGRRVLAVTISDFVRKN